jgi:hypothetical protein
LTGSGVVYTRSIGERELTFDFAGGLLNDNLLFVDRETGSVWSQLHGKAIHGPMKDTPLISVPVMQTTWAFWRGLYPGTRVMIVEEEDGRPYLYRNRKPGAPQPDTPAKKHDTSGLGLGYASGGDAIFFSFSELKRAGGTFEVRFAGELIRVNYSKAGLTAWVTDMQGSLLNSILVYRDAWVDFFPDTFLYERTDG